MSIFETVTLGELSNPKQYPILPKNRMTTAGYPVYGANGCIGHSASYTHLRPTILIGCRGTCGVVHVTTGKSYANGNAMALDDLDQNRISIPYLAYFLKARGFRDVIGGSVQLQIIRANLVRIEIPIPPLVEQRRIATILDQADAIRRKHLLGMLQSEQALRCLSQRAYWGGLSGSCTSAQRLTNGSINGSTEARPVSLGEVVTELESGSRPEGGIRINQGDIPSLGVEHLAEDRGFRFTNIRYIPRSFFDSMHSGKIKLHDILIARVGATTGKASYVSSAFPFPDCAISQHVFRIAIREQVANSRYVFHYLHSPRGQVEILKRFRGSVIGYIDRKFVDDVKFPLPPLAEQRRIAAVLDQVDAIYRKQQLGMTLAEQALRALSQRAFRGEM